MKLASRSLLPAEKRVRFGVALPALIAAALLASPSTFAAGTAAGTVIDNTAQANFDLGGSNFTQDSNTVSVTVAERIDVLVTLLSSQVQVNAGDSTRSLLFSVTNSGNGSEAWQLAIDSGLGGDDFDPVPANPSIYFDTDGSGDYNTGDTAYVPGSNDPVLAADESVNMLLVNEIPADALDGELGHSELSAVAATGSGNPGDVFAGLGDGGVDAVIGATGGSATEFGEYVVADVQMNVIKSVVVADPSGGNSPVPGATLTYSITVEVTSTGTATDAQFNDVIPGFTTFVPSSIELNGSALSDAADTDAGELNTAGTPAVVVRLGDLTQASGTQTVNFQVTID
ncbi:MAG: hypothetical protein KJO31_00690 [Gammaproteobacteria bacterium]|nr:hypothetical protein [Gammaproteobacteria bacterium]